MQISKLVLATGMMFVGIPAAEALTISTVGGDQGHGSGIPMNLTPAVSVGGSSVSSQVLSGEYTHQLPLPVAASNGTLVTVTASAVALVPIFSGSATFQHINGRLLAWQTDGILICAGQTTTWVQNANPVKLALPDSCVVNPTLSRPEAEFGLGNTQSQQQAFFPRLFSVTYQY